MLDKKFYPRPLWFWNAKPTLENISEVMKGCVERDNYAGFGILPFDACKLEYMGEEYLALYRTVLENAKKFGVKICLYDEWWFPSGAAGGLLKKKYPEACAKRLDLCEFSIARGKNVISVPQDGELMAAVAVFEDERVDVSCFVCDGKLVYESSKEGTAMFFMLCPSGWDCVDYLDKGSVRKFIALTHDVYYENFSEYFGSVIDSVFYDEPQFYTADGRMWTASFNERFREKYGYSPATLYPALFYDMGEETAWARNALLSLRSDMYAQGFVRTVQDWCTAHGVALTGQDRKSVV